MICDLTETIGAAFSQNILSRPNTADYVISAICLHYAR